MLYLPNSWQAIDFYKNNTLIYIMYMLSVSYFSGTKSFARGGGGGELPYETEGDACRKF